MAKGDYPKYEDGDYICSVCGEPWEAYSIRNLQDDWTRAQVAAFKAGLGCPSCLKDEALTRLGEELLEKQKGPDVCDSCLTAAWDEGAGAGMEDATSIGNLQRKVCITMGSEISDHLCDARELGIQCACACNKVRAVANPN